MVFLVQGKDTENIKERREQINGNHSKMKRKKKEEYRESK